MDTLRFLLVITATALLPLAARAQTNAPAATLAEQIESARRQLETRFGTNRPAAFEQSARANAERAYYSPKFAAAVQAGDTNALLQLFRELPELMDSRNLDSPTVLGKAALTMAAERGDLPMVDFLLRRKASPDAVPQPSGVPFGMPFGPSRLPSIGGMGGFYPQRTAPLNAAARGGHVAVVERLLAAGAAVDARDTSGRTALADCLSRIAGPPSFRPTSVPPDQAAIDRQHQIVRVLLQHGAQVLGDSNYGGPTAPLGIAAGWGNEELVDRLLTNSRPAAITATNRIALRETLLHTAVRLGRTNALAALLARRPRAELTRTNAAGLTPLQLTAAALTDQFNTGVQGVTIVHPRSPLHSPQLQRHACAGLLLAAGAELDVFAAAGLDRAADLRQLLERNPGAAAGADARGRTPLHWAVLARATNTVEVLLANRAALNAADSRGATALHLATGLGDSSLIGRLLAAGADVHAVDPSGQTALHHAARLAGPEPLATLLHAGAKPDQRDRAGKSPLDLAAELNLAENIRRLTAAAPAGSPLARELATTVFLAAAARGDLAQITNGLAQGVDVNMRNPQGRTALRLAVDGGHLGLLPVLQQAGADLNLGDTNGVTALMSSIANHRNALDERLLNSVPPTLMRRDASLPPHLRPPAISSTGDPLLWLLANGADLARTNLQGMTALFHLPPVGADFSNPGGPEQVRQTTVLARYLVQRGANPDAHDREGRTPLHRALFEGDLVRAVALLEAGANLEAADQRGRTAIHHAVMGVGYGREIGRPDVHGHGGGATAKNLGPVLSFVIANGADVRRADALGRTPLHTLLSERPIESAYFAGPLLTNEHGPALVRTLDHSNSLPAHLAFAQLPGPASIEGLRLAIRLAQPVIDRAGGDAQGRNLLHLAAAAPYLWRPTGGQFQIPQPAFFPLGEPTGELAKEWRDLLEKLAANRLLVRGTDTAGDTPLHAAARHNHGELARLLLAQGADPKARNRKGESPYDIANADHTPVRPSSVVPLLLKAGVVPETRAFPATPAASGTPGTSLVWPEPVPGSVRTNFLALVQAGQWEQVDDWVRENPALATVTNQGFVPLRAAALAGQTVVVERLRAAGASDLVTAALLGWTNMVADLLAKQPGRAAEVTGAYPLLHWAVRHGQPAAARLILARLPPPLAPDHYGLSARYHARTNGHAELLDVLKAHGDAFTLFDAIELRDAALMQQVLARTPASVNQPNGSTEPPLFLATMANDLALVKLLLAAKADPNQRSSFNPFFPVPGSPTNPPPAAGNLPLHWAAWTNALDIGRLLLNHGAEVDAATVIGATPLHYAIDQGHRAFAELLVSRKAKVSFLPERVAQRPWMTAPAMVPVRTALHIAIGRGRVDLVRWLLEQGADTEVMDGSGLTPRDMATRVSLGAMWSIGLGPPRHGTPPGFIRPWVASPPVPEADRAAISVLIREHWRKAMELK